MAQKMEEETEMDDKKKEEFLEVQPNQTIYINNLNERIKKEELRKALYAMFSQFGTILDVVALKTLKMRGQAFVVFKDVNSATNALRTMQNFPFFDKPMRIQYAKGKSDVISKMDGTYVPRERKRMEKRKQEELEEVRKRQAQKNQGRPEKRGKRREEEGGSSGTLQPKQQPPNKILFVENLPDNTTDAVLVMLFQQYPGFKEIRMVQGKGGKLAFVEFESEAEAGVAMANLQHYKISPTNIVVISYAKRG